MNLLSRPGYREAPWKHRPTLSVIVPVFNEHSVLPLCYSRLHDVLTRLRLPHELLFIDDGSSDGSGEYLSALACTRSEVKLIRFSRNFGKEAAMSAGIEHATGDAVVILDADLQDPPELIPDMVATWSEGADVVCMRRRSREGETWFKRVTALAYYRLLSRISHVPIPEDIGDFRLLSRHAIEALRQLPERNRYMKGLFAWIGMPTRILEYDRAPRAAGRSQWSYIRLLGLAFEGITSFSIAPLRCAIVLGFMAATGGTLFGAGIVAKTLFFGEPVQGYPSLMAVMTFLGGIQLLTIGLLGEYVGKVYLEVKQRPLYLIRDIVQGYSVSEADGADRETLYVAPN